MGQKINPTSFRLGVTKNWPVRWFIKNGYAKFLAEDDAIRKTIRKKIGVAGISGIEIERTQGNLRILIRAARPGLIIGRGGKGVEDLNKGIANAIRKVRNSKAPIPMNVTIEELKRSEVSAPYFAQQIAWDLERRMPFRRTMKRYLELIMQNREVKGVKIALSGLVDGPSTISRHEWLSRGSLPLQKLRADIDYGTITAFTVGGAIGIRVWIHKGEILSKKAQEPKTGI